MTTRAQQGLYRTRTKPTKKQPVTKLCKKPAWPLPRYWRIPFADGAVLWHAIAPLAEHGCVHCLCDSLVEFGLLRHSADGQIESPLTSGCHGMRENSAWQLVHILLAQSVGPLRDINVFSDGGRC
jgi:hypothetical protein